MGPFLVIYNMGGLSFIYDDGFDAYHLYFKFFYTPSFFILIIGAQLACCSFDYFANYIVDMVRERKSSVHDGSVVPLERVPSRNSAHDLSETKMQPPAKSGTPKTK